MEKETYGLCLKSIQKQGVAYEKTRSMSKELQTRNQWTEVKLQSEGDFSGICQ